MNEIPANLLYSPDELERWLDDTSVPLSNDEMCDMSVYFDEKNLCTTNDICDIIKVDEDNKETTK